MLCFLCLVFVVFLVFFFHHRGKQAVFALMRLTSAPSPLLSAAVLSAGLRGLHTEHCLLGQGDSTLATWSLRKWSRNQRGWRREEQCQTPRSSSHTDCHCPLGTCVWLCGRAFLWLAEPCFGVAPGTNMALPRGAMLGLI